ncbi:MAG: Rossmann-fold NAD(P)-binding domain-containing protein [Ruminiclostridium sp.]
MNNKTDNVNDFKKVVVGTIAAIGICVLSFSGLTNSAKAALVNKTESIPTTYSSTASEVKESGVPKGYVKADYHVKLLEFSDKPTVKDISAEAAAEFGAQDLWRLFGADLNDKTIQMCYNVVSSDMPRAEWTGLINVNENLCYGFMVDAVTGEVCSTSKLKYWSGNISVDFSKEQLKNSEQYTSLAKEAAEKYQLVSGKVVSAEYDGQCYIANNDDSARNPEIFIMVTSDNGQQAQFTFSRYKKEFLQVAYDSCVKEMKAVEKKLEEDIKKKQQTRKEQKNNENSAPKLIPSETTK